MSTVRRILYPGRQYLLRDDFNDDRAAGALNGTPATPGPGMRVGVDTGAKMSQSGGQLIFASGAWGDPGLWYGAMTRVAGRIIFSRFNASTIDDAMPLGWDTNQAGTLDATAFNLQNPGIPYIRNWDGTTLLVLATISQNQAYDLAIVLRGTGAYSFIKGGAFVTWTLLWIQPSGSQATLYPGIVNKVATFMADYICIPARLWLPPVLAHDTFTRADAALGNTEPAGPDGQGAPVLAWTGATWTIATNKAINTPTLGDELAAGNLVVGTWYSITATQADYFYVGCAIADTFRATAATVLDANNKVRAITLASLFATLPDVGTPNVVIDATLAAYTSPTQMGIVARLNSAAAPANFIIAIQDGANVKVTECVAGVYTNLATVASAFAAGNVLRLDLSGANYRLYKVTSAGVATLISASTTNVLTGNLHGMMDTLAGAGNAFSKFTVAQKAGYSPPCE